jgi:uncharacterized protein (TIGR03435 family)
MRIALLLFAFAAFAQSPSFEVVSIKPSPPPEGGGMSVSSGGGPGSRDPSRWRCVNMSLSNIVHNAFELRTAELSAPEWMGDVRFDITAKVPDGATREQFREMMVNMLRERFGLKYHREKKEVAGYELVVGKGGPKFKESAPEPPKDTNAEPPKPGAWRSTPGADGYPVLPPGVFGMSSMRGRSRAQWPRTTMSLLAANLSGQVDKPVVDATGLTGKYDVSLYWMAGWTYTAPSSGEAASEPAGPTIFTAVQEQLGLKLEPRKVMIDVLVIDHAERSPTEN